ncbi:hypothetical protein T06_2336 [Trichinella sp. T6]|nr:hypothetical protein T06_2336 [Trichinella sp. T6]
MWRFTLVRLRSKSDVDSTSANSIRIAASVDWWLPLASCSLGSIFSIASLTRLWAVRSDLGDSALTGGTASDFPNGMSPCCIL